MKNRSPWRVLQTLAYPLVLASYVLSIPHIVVRGLYEIGMLARRPYNYFRMRAEGWAFEKGHWWYKDRR